jgi:hypothetical protein
MILSIILTIFSIALFINIVILYIEATNTRVADGSALKINKYQEKKNIFTGWIKNITQINNKVFVLPSTEAILEFPDDIKTKEKEGNIE